MGQEDENKFKDKIRFRTFLDYLIEITENENEEKYDHFKNADTEESLKELLKQNDVFVTSKECEKILLSKNQYVDNKLGLGPAY